MKGGTIYPTRVNRQLAATIFEIQDFKERSFTNNRSPKAAYKRARILVSGGVDPKIETHRSPFWIKAVESAPIGEGSPAPGQWPRKTSVPCRVQLGAGL
jgi:hypothetical protein